MRTTFEVMDAVRNGTEATDEELRYALHNVAIWHNRMVFDLARALNEDPLSAKTKRGLQRAWDSWGEGNKVPLDVRLKGGSFEPGVPREERTERFIQHTSAAAVKLAGTLTAMREAGQK